MNASLWQLAGWTMIHSLWLGAAVALAGGFLRLAVRRTTPNTRYAISLATLTALAISPLAAAAWLSINGVPQLARTAPASPLLPLPLGEGWGEGLNHQAMLASPHANAANEAPILALPPQFTERPDHESPITGHSSPEVIDLAHLPPSPQLAGERGGEFDPLPTPPPANATATAGDFPNTTVGSPSPSFSPARGTPLLSSHQSPITDHLLRLSPFIPYLPILWLVGAPLTFMLLAAGLVGSERLRRRATPLVAGPAFDACQRMRTALRITRRVALAACEGVAQPVLVGVFRPLILLPTAALAGWTPEQLDMILLHELAHVRRWDNLVNLLQRIVESILFYHPAVWILSRQVRHDREECCDATVIRHTDRPHQYAELLVSIAAALRGGPAPSLAVASAMASHPLAGRIRRILNIEAEPMRITRRTLAATLLLPAILAGAILYSGANAEDGGTGGPGSPNQGGAATGSKEPKSPQLASTTPSPSATKDETAAPASAQEPAEPTLDDEIARLQTALREGEIEVAQLRIFEDISQIVGPARPHFNLVVRNASYRDPAVRAATRRIAQINDDLRNVVKGTLTLSEDKVRERQRKRKEASQQLADAREQFIREQLAQLEKLNDDEILSVSTEKVRRLQELSKEIETLEIDLSIAKKLAKSREETQAAGSPGSPNQGGAATRSAANDVQPTANASSGSAASVQEPTLPAARSDANANRTQDEIAQLQTKIRNIEEAIRQTQDELTNLEVFKQIAQQQAPNSALIDEAVAAALKDDKKLESLEKRLQSIEEGVAAEELNLANESSDKDGETLKRLRELRETAQMKRDAYLADTTRAIRDRLTKPATEAYRASAAHYKTRRKAADENLAKYQQELEDARQKLSQLDADQAGGSASSNSDDPATASLPASAEGRTSLQALAQSEEELKKVFEPRPDNPSQTVDYATDKIPQQDVTLYEDMFQGLQKDPHGPQLVFTYDATADRTHIKITAPQEAHRRFFKPIFAGELPKAAQAATDPTLQPLLTPEDVLKKTLADTRSRLKNRLAELKEHGADDLKEIRAGEVPESQADNELSGALQQKVEAWKAMNEARLKAEGEAGPGSLASGDAAAGSPGSPNQGGAATRSPDDDAQPATNASPGSAAPVQEPELPANPTAAPDPRLANLLPLSAKDFTAHFVFGPDNQLSEYSYEVDPDMLPAIRERLDAALDLLRASNPTPRFVVNYRGANVISIIAAERAQHSLLVDQTTGHPVAGLKRLGRSYSSPATNFPTLENQKIADRAYKLLGLELEPLNPQDLERVKKLGYTGGLCITRANQMAGTDSDDLLVGLHVWPITDLKSLDEVLQREDLSELNPLKYYLIRNMPDSASKGGRGGFRPGPMKDTIVTGRLQIPEAELLSRGLEQTNQVAAQLATSALLARDLGHYTGQTADNVPAGSPGSPNQGGAATRSPDDGVPPAANASPGSAPPVQEPEPPAQPESQPSAAEAGDLHRYIGNATSSASDFAAVSVIQPPTSLKTGLFGTGSMTTAYLKVKRHRDLGVFDSANDRVTPQEIERQAMNCLAIIKSPAVLQAALKSFTPREASGMQPEDAVEWLKKRLIAAFPGDGEILELKLEGNDAKEDSILLQAVIDAFITEMDAPPASPADPTTTPAVIAASEPTFLYDGKTFEQWRDLWKLELNPKRRVEAIKALTAFSRAGRGRESADAVFEVASQYDFGKNYSNEEDEVKFTVIKLCTEGGNQIATTDWLPALEKVLKKDPKQNKQLALWLLQQMQDTSDEARAALQVLAANDDPEVSAAAKEAWAWRDNLLEKLMKADADGDQQISKQEATAAKPFSMYTFVIIDKDEDGQLSIEELQKAMPYPLERHGRGGMGGGMSGGAGGGFF